MAIEDQLGDQSSFDRVTRLQELFDETTRVQLNAGDLLTKLGSANDLATTAQLVEVLEVALAGVQASRQALVEIHFAITGAIPKEL